jgi:L-seryl-tRNA(Ser) seleniumtransferase
MASHRVIPSIEQLLQRPALTGAVRDHGRAVVTGAVRQAAAELRSRFSAGGPATELDAAAWIETRALAVASAQTSSSLVEVINATGVVLHTNLGRAPLASSAAARAAQMAAAYTNLEYDLEHGTRGHRHVHAERLLCTLTGADRAIVVNNAAAAALLALSALASGREVIVSRGELVEIGGGFRVPEVLAQSGAVLREVGTTNRTRVSDYAAAISDRTAAILRVHPSNFHIEGFTERPQLRQLATLAARFGVPLIEDLGSGWLGLIDGLPGASGEPMVRESLEAGVNLVVFSGDKLLGGPQAGIVVGREDLVASLAAHPLMRALRVDKMTYAALEGTLQLWAGDESRLSIPIVRMLAATKPEIEARALAITRTLAGASGLSGRVIDGHSTVGGGSAPGSTLPTALLALESGILSASALAARLRGARPPVIARIENDRVVLDLRTVPPDQDETVIQALQAVARG